METKKDGKKGTKPFRIYYDPNIRQVSDIRKDIAKTVGQWSHKNLSVDYYKENQGTIKWNCYKCRVAINIDMKKFNTKSVFCDDHKPKILTNEYKRDAILMRYVSSLFTHIKSIITKNSNTDLYG